MCMCSRNATKPSPLCTANSFWAPFSQRILCLHIIKWSAAKWAVEHGFSFSLIVKCSKQKPIKKGVKRQGKERISHANRGKSGQMSAHCWLWQRGGETRTQLNGTTESAELCRRLWGESPFTSPDRQTAPVEDLTHPPICPFTPAPGWKREQYQSRDHLADKQLLPRSNYIVK